MSRAHIARAQDPTRQERHGGRGKPRARHYHRPAERVDGGGPGRHKREAGPSAGDHHEAHRPG
eukprot:2347240-Prorocentrum_lima.AAC.1